MKHLFIGLDVHKKSWSVTIQKVGMILKRSSMEPQPPTLVAYVKKYYPDYGVECCYESCCPGYHIYRALTAEGWNVLVVNPGDIPRVNKQCSSKIIKTHVTGNLFLAKQIACK